MIDKLKANNINLTDDLDEEYWEEQEHIILPNYSDYVVYPKQGLIWSKKRNKWIGAKTKRDRTELNGRMNDAKN